MEIARQMSGYSLGGADMLRRAMGKKIQEAMDAGMLSALAEPGQALDAAITLAERIAENAPLAVAASKSLVRSAAQGIDEDTLWEMQIPLQKKVFSSNDAKEGPTAFAEKRAPNWTGT